MRVLVACEFSGVVRRAFAALGHDAWSCDLLPAEDGSPRHIQGDVSALLRDGWDLIVAHPPCTRLCNSGVRWLHERSLWSELDRSCELVERIWSAPCPRLAVENPIMHRYARERLRVLPSPYFVQPWQFGHGESKAIGLWTRGLPRLTPTDVVSGRAPRVHFASPGPDRWKVRSRFYPGVAEAMAAQWGSQGSAPAPAPILLDAEKTKLDRDLLLVSIPRMETPTPPTQLDLFDL